MFGLLCEVSRGGVFVRYELSRSDNVAANIKC